MQSMDFSLMTRYLPKGSDYIETRLDIQGPRLDVTFIAFISIFFPEAERAL